MIVLIIMGLPNIFDNASNFFSFHGANLDAFFFFSAFISWILIDPRLFQLSFAKKQSCTCRLLIPPNLLKPMALTSKHEKPPPIPP